MFNRHCAHRTYLSLLVLGLTALSATAGHAQAPPTTPSWARPIPSSSPQPATPRQPQTQPQRHPAAQGAVQPGVRWSPNLNLAAAEARRQHKPLLLVFGAPWCKFCKKLEQETLGYPQLTAVVNDQFVPVHIDFDQHRELAERLGVKSLPATVVLGPDVRYWGAIDGYAPPAEFYRQLATIGQSALGAVPQGAVVR